MLISRKRILDFTIMAISKKLRFEVFKRDNFTCKYCGRKTPEVILEADHIIPISKGGTDDADNLVTSCYACNRGKGATLLDTVLKDKDIHEETILMAEREMQLKEYNHIREQIHKREARDMKKLKDHFCKHFKYREYAEEQFPESIIRDALKIMSYVDIMDLIDYAVSRTKDSPEYHNVAAAKYLFGILRNKLEAAGGKPLVP